MTDILPYPSDTYLDEEPGPATHVGHVDLEGMTYGIHDLGIGAGATVGEIIDALQQLPRDMVSTGQIGGSMDVLLAFYAPEDLDGVLAFFNQPGHGHIHEAIGAYRARRAVASEAA
ncbi:hypothetical protein [Frankia sp. CeD]|uniref:hypothetical protein n=1 Tax=Frankia sp. CeD TaxID=258230 RepID=UPI0004DCFA8A|nr:hypothetical protein [Frankia sp. CeD]KEZ35830.1 hypothetical protein CEDDRAFT_02826 [Frankia sp. CeD]